MQVQGADGAWRTLAPFRIIDHRGVWTTALEEVGPGTAQGSQPDSGEAGAALPESRASSAADPPTLSMAEPFAAAAPPVFTGPHSEDPKTMDDSSLLMVKLDGMDQAKCKLDSISSEGRGVMKLTSEQIATELQALHNAVEESFSHVENHVLPSRRDQCFRLLQLVAGVLRQEQLACAIGVWQEMDVEEIAGELQALQTVVNHVVDLIVNDQIIAELSAK